MVPTVGGGAQVTFNDVEVMKQISPSQAHSPSRKRASSPYKENRYRTRARSSNYGDMEVIADKCSTAIAHCSNAGKRSRNN